MLHAPLHVQTVREQQAESQQQLGSLYKQWHRKIGFVGLSLAAAALLVTSMPSDSPVSGNLENMTAKGLEQSAPKIHLKLARIEEGQATRHRTTLRS